MCASIASGKSCSINVCAFVFPGHVRDSSIVRECERDSCVQGEDVVRTLRLGDPADVDDAA